MPLKYIATTRFNDDTFKQYDNYKKKYNIHGCIYGSPFQIKEYIPLGSIIYIIEMNNSKNKIEGIGIIKNKIHLDKSYRIYQDKNYNRYIYKGNIRLDVAQINDPYYKKLIHVLEQLLFKGARHSKRATGITQLPSWILNNKYHFDFVKCFNKLFKTYYNTIKKI